MSVKAKNGRITGKVHYTINPPCGCHKRWGSCEITSTRNPEDVSCKNCLKIMQGQ